MVQISFTQTLSIDALTANGSNTNDVRCFLEGTGWEYTESETVNGFLRGTIHEQGQPVNSPTRTFFTQDSVIVKVDGRFSRVMVRSLFDKIYD